MEIWKLQTCHAMLLVDGNGMITRTKIKFYFEFQISFLFSAIDVQNMVLNTQ